ncbi:MAG: hypothetical protein ACR2QA_02825 [Solirubrobacteraceae bacterium]
MPDIEIRDLQRGEICPAVALLARGMRDNPLNVAVYGTDPDRRRRALERMFTTLFRVFDAQQPLCALDGQTLVGVAGVAPVGTCQPTAAQSLGFLPGMLAMGPTAARRVGAWLAVWGRHDPDQPHIHLGPVAVNVARQGRGIGSQIMSEHCRRLDASGETGSGDRQAQERRLLRATRVRSRRADRGDRGAQLVHDPPATATLPTSSDRSASARMQHPPRSESRNEAMTFRAAVDL